jgi:hypothetical protein
MALPTFMRAVVTGYVSGCVLQTCAIHGLLQWNERSHKPSVSLSESRNCRCSDVIR